MIIGIIAIIVDRLARRNPIEYARKLGVKVGNDCRFTGNPGWGSEPWLIQIGNHVLLSADIKFITHDASTFLFRDTEEYKNVFKFAPIVIHDNCFIGMRATILSGVEIGTNSIVGAGSLVTRSIPPGEVWGGVPARFICTTKDFADKCKKNRLPLDMEAYKKDMKSELLRVVRQKYSFLD